MKALPCPPALWQRFSALLDTALELDDSAREAWLAGLAADDAELKPWLAAVLGHRLESFGLSDHHQNQSGSSIS